MRRISVIFVPILVIIAIGVSGAHAGAAKKGGKRLVIIETNMGNMTVELDPAKAPVTVENFLRYAREGHYDGLIFHRVIRNFMIQGGGFTKDMRERKTAHPPIRNEAGNGLRNDRGTLAMARTGVVDSATAQFFINVVNNDFLNHRDETPRGFGYAVFGKVVEGTDVVDKIREVPTTRVGAYDDVPVQPVTIVKVREIKP